MCYRANATLSGSTDGTFGSIKANIPTTGKVGSRDTFGVSGLNTRDMNVGSEAVSKELVMVARRKVRKDL